ncbi:hypothetical protein [Micrococcoides hystricis]|uniref:Uncharacterized protein n=1 Tax=Micrococcoides hystricis TaxID=1572761 RepID=A0ABV6P9K7_9MICC
MDDVRKQRFERAPVAVCWTTPRQAWLLVNVSDQQAASSVRSLFVEVFTQPLDEDEWQWRDSYYPDDAIKRGFWAHQFAETGTPRSFDLAEEQLQLPEVRAPRQDTDAAERGGHAPGASPKSGMNLFQRLVAALRR